MHLMEVGREGASSKGFATGGTRNLLALVFLEAGAFASGPALASSGRLVYDKGLGEGRHGFGLVHVGD